MQPSEHRVRTSDVTLFVREYGDREAPVVIALHGWPDSGRGWSRVAPLLAEHFRVLVPDNRGFGRSDKPVGTANYRMNLLVGDVAALAEWAGVDRIHLAGHDFGSVVTWGTAMFAPNLLSRAVTMAGPHPMRIKSVAGNLQQIMKSAYTFLLNVGPEGEALLAAQDFGLLERFAFGSNPAIGPDERAGYRAEWSQPGAFTAMAEWYRAHYRPSLLNPDVPLELPKTTVPIRYLHGKNDFAFVPELAQTNEPFVAGPYDHVLLDTSHWMLYEQPQEVAALIVDWFRRS